MDCLVTIAIGEDVLDLAALSLPSFNRYAKKYGLGFEIITKRVLTEGTDMFPSYEKLGLGCLFNKYDRIMFVDIDAYILDTCPNLLKLVPRETFGARKVDIKDKWKNRICDDFGDVVEMPDYFNSGVFLASKEHRDIFSLPGEVIHGGKIAEQTTLNYQVARNGVKLTNIGWNFNAINPKKKYINRAYIIHYAGGDVKKRHKKMEDGIKQINTCN